MLPIFIIIAALSTEPPVAVKAEPTDLKSLQPLIDIDIADVASFQGQVATHTEALKKSQSDLNTANDSLDKHLAKLAEFRGGAPAPVIPPKPDPKPDPKPEPVPVTPPPPPGVAKLTLIAIADYPQDSPAWADSVVVAMMEKTGVVLSYGLTTGHYDNKNLMDWLVKAKEGKLPYTAIADSSGHILWEARNATVADISAAISAATGNAPATATKKPHSRTYSITTSWCQYCPMARAAIQAMEADGFYAEDLNQGSQHFPMTVSVESVNYSITSLPTIIICKTGKPPNVLSNFKDHVPTASELEAMAR